jgi:hypothetical protein
MRDERMHPNRPFGRIFRREGALSPLWQSRDTGERRAGFRGVARWAEAREITYAAPTMREGICEVQGH